MFNINIQLSLKQHMEQNQIQNKFIRPHFLNVENYKQLSKKGQRRGNVYCSLCSILQQRYAHIINFMNLSLAGLGKINTTKTYSSQLKEMFKNIGTVAKDVSSYQSDCLSQIRSSYQNKTEQLTDIMLEKIQPIRQLQNNCRQNMESYREKNKTLIDKKSSIKQLIQQIQNKKKLAEYYYDRLYIESFKNFIQKQRQKLNLNIKQLSTLNEDSKKYAKIFNKYFLSYRKRIKMEKNANLQQLRKLSKNTLQGLYQSANLMVTVIKEHIANYQNKGKETSGTFLEVFQPKKSAIDILSMKQQNWEKQLADDLQQIENITNCISKSSLAARNSKPNDSFRKDLSQILKQEYQLNNLQIELILQPLRLFDTFIQNVQEVGKKCEQFRTEVKAIRYGIFKHLKIVTYLKGKADNTNFRPKTLSQANIKFEQSRTVGMHGSIISVNSDNPNNEIVNEEEIKQKIDKFYIGIYTLFKDVCQNMQSKIVRRKKQTDNSMELSWIEETRFIHRDAVFTSGQQWLYEQFLEENTHEKKEQQALKIINESEEIEKSLPSFKKPSSYQKQFGCFLQRDGNLIQGVLKLSPEAITFKGEKIRIILPILNVNGIQEKTSILSPSFIVINTDLGYITLKKAINMRNMKQAILQAIDHPEQAQQANEQIAVEQSVKLTDKQIQVLKTRKEKISSELQNKQNYFKLNEYKFTNISVDKIYSLLFSNEPYTISGKTYQNFAEFYLSKLNNFDIQQGKWSPPGPKFYSGDQNVDFTNCQTFSTKENNFKHKLPRMLMLPQFGNVKQKCKLFWISNQQFHYYAEAQVHGVPYSDCFYTKNFIIVQQSGNDTQLQVYSQIIFVKSTMMESTLKGRTKSQLEQGFRTTINLYKNRVNAYKKSLAKNANKDQKEEDSVIIDKKQDLIGSRQVKTQSYPISKIPLTSQQLVIVVTIVLVLLVILKVVF